MPGISSIYLPNGRIKPSDRYTGSFVIQKLMGPDIMRGCQILYIGLHILHP